MMRVLVFLFERSSLKEDCPVQLGDNAGLENNFQKKFPKKITKKDTISQFLIEKFRYYVDHTLL